MIYFKALAVLPLKICVGILFLTACGPETRYELKAIQPSGPLEEYEERTDVSVSYTHLTLPTICSV